LQEYNFLPVKGIKKGESRRCQASDATEFLTCTRLVDANFACMTNIFTFSSTFVIPLCVLFQVDHASFNYNEWSNF